MSPTPPSCASCRYSTKGYDALLCIYSRPFPADMNRNPRGLCGPGASLWKAIELKKRRATDTP